MQNKKNYLQGLRDGTPISLGYFAVGFTLGIAAKAMGLTAFQAGLMSATMHASAGEFAVLTVIAGQSGYLSMIITQLVINMRYFFFGLLLITENRQRHFSAKAAPPGLLCHRRNLRYLCLQKRTAESIL